MRSAIVSRSWLQLSVALSVCWRSSADRLPAVSTARQSPSRSAICAGESAPTRAAASSSASGIPSSRRQISATDPALSSLNAKPAATSLARSQNSRTDS